MKKIVLLLLSIFVTMLPSVSYGKTSDVEDLFFMEIPNVITPSKFSEKISETPSTIMVVTDQEIARRGYSSIVEVMQDIPGFEVKIMNSDTYALFYPRGIRTEVAERVLLLIDGRSFQSLGYQYSAMNRNFPLSGIKQIEIMMGPSSAIYGPDAFSAVINIITKKPEDLDEKMQELSVNTVGGSFDTKYIDASYVGEFSNDIGLSITGRYFKTANPDYSNKPGYFSNEIISKYWGAWGLSKYENPQENYAFFSTLSRNGFELGWHSLGISQSQSVTYPLDYQGTKYLWKEFRNLFFASYDFDVTDKLNLKLQMSYKDGDTPSDCINMERYDNNNDGIPDTAYELFKYFNMQYMYQGDFVYSSDDQTTVTGGLNYIHNDFQKAYSITQYWAYYFPDGHYEYQPPVFPGAGNNRFTMENPGGYVQIKKPFLDDNLIVVGGVRYDKNSVYEDATNPRIGFVYKFPELILKLNYGTGYQYPSPRQVYAGFAGTTVSEGLQSEKIRAYGLNLLTATGIFKNELDLYYNDITNTTLLGQNLPAQKVYGGEFKATAKIGNAAGVKNMELYFCYSYVNPRFVTDVSDAVTKRSSNVVGDTPFNKFNLGIEADLSKNMHLALRNLWADETNTIVSNPVEKVDSYFVSNMFLKYNNFLGCKELSLSLLINNLFDAEYYHAGMGSGAAGEDMSIPSQGYYSSRLPQYPRSFLLNISCKI